ncbi:MAG TPA: type II and III secretion system protein family protein [Vicinamibacterales bacterium]|jgi:pilus assembly protein CpaC
MTPRWRSSLAIMSLVTLGFAHAAPAQIAQVSTPAPPSLLVVAGGSTVVQTDFPITRIAVTNPDVADATVLDANQVLVDGKTAGSVSLIIWGADNRMVQYTVVVYPATPSLQRQLKLLFPGEDIQVNQADEAVVLSGKVSSNTIALRAVEIAEKSSAKFKVINMLQIPGGDLGQQVMLQVRVAEVSQRALTELGSSFFTGNAGYGNWMGRVTTEQFAAPGFIDRIGPPPATNPNSEGKLTFTDFLNLFLFNTRYDVGTVISALKTRGYFQSLAEPTLIAYNGQEASFLAGGEIPIPLVQGSGVNASLTVNYKEFGVRLTFKPTISGNVIRMKVKPEVSSLDFANGVTLTGFRIPALVTRRTETDVELRDGQSFAIGGLLNNISQNDLARIPVLGDLPVIGYLFRSKAERKERTELVVIITPHLVQPLNQEPALPTNPERFLSPTSDADDAKEDHRAAAEAGQPESAESKVCFLAWCR